MKTLGIILAGLLSVSLMLGKEKEEFKPIKYEYVVDSKSPVSRINSPSQCKAYLSFVVHNLKDDYRILSYSLDCYNKTKLVALDRAIDVGDTIIVYSQKSERLGLTFPKSIKKYRK